VKLARKFVVAGIILTWISGKLLLWQGLELIYLRLDPFVIAGMDFEFLYGRKFAVLSWKLHSVSRVANDMILILCALCLSQIVFLSFYTRELWDKTTALVNI
jgi:hypothetical protein